ncbi:hypothetical protein [Hydromonas duriensis]|uniref:Uncharacterized protein n=1 Tax=Hydromonas duriensis TaxID=1527608 RepID=A0A4R6Y5H4_9BURK|nr:hypothetical protein [Hydromonas duriensis]TDR30687.1 hypothetical protein DFR44_11837 [Hydromonas duriensis]
MPIDSLKVSRHYRRVRDESLTTLVWQPAINTVIMPNETLDPTIANQRVYGSRADWYATAAIAGLNSVDEPMQEGARRFLTPIHLRAHSQTRQRNHVEDLY